MSKIYDLYPSYERKIDNWRKRILGYEKMKKDMQRQIQILKNKNKKQKEVIDKINNFCKDDKNFEILDLYSQDIVDEIQTNLLDILKEVSE